jgi:predicted AlkP superfamily phosphohydrolase/phosphomutase
LFEQHGYEIGPVNATSRRAKTVWEVLSEAGLKVIVVNVPVTYPPEKVNGIMISGIVGLRNVSSDYTYPLEINNDLRQLGYVLDLPVEQSPDIQQVLEMIEKRKKTVIHLINNYDWDLFIVVFLALDRVQHFFWNSMSGSNQDSPNRNIILRTYEELDNVIQELLSLVGDNTNIFLFSDHGFGSLHKEIFINNWLRELGLLQQIELKIDSKPSFSSGKNYDGKLGRLKGKVKGLVRKSSFLFPKLTQKPGALPVEGFGLIYEEDNH